MIMQSEVKKDIILKDGRTFRKGSHATIEFINEGFKNYMVVTINGDSFKTSPRNGHKNLTGFCKPPSMNKLEAWSFDCVARSVTGKRCEPDGFGCDNSPSWLLVLGYI